MNRLHETGLNSIQWILHGRRASDRLVNADANQRVKVGVVLAQLKKERKNLINVTITGGNDTC